MNHHTKQSLIDFESQVKQLWEDGDLRMLIHLCGGNEEQLIEIFRQVQPGDWVFSTHRNHYHALLSGIPAERLLDRIKAGGSMFVYNNISKGNIEHSTLNLEPRTDCNFVCSAILAGNCSMAVGVAVAIKERCEAQNARCQAAGTGGTLAGERPRPAHVWCFVGDGAEEEGHFYEAVCFAIGHTLPVTFIIEDNNRQVDTDKATRRGHEAPLLPCCCFMPGLSGTLPLWEATLVHYKYKPTYPHAGSGSKHHIQFKR